MRYLAGTGYSSMGYLILTIYGKCTCERIRIYDFVMVWFCRYLVESESNFLTPQSYDVQRGRNPDMVGNLYFFHDDDFLTTCRLVCYFS